MATTDELQALIEPVVNRLGYSLVRVTLMGGSRSPTLQVMAERPDTRQLDLEDCARISRALSDLLDEADPIETEYRLEVSSPGIDRPLTRPKDFDDWRGHEARLTLGAGVEGRKRFQGVLAGGDFETVELQLPDGASVRIPRADIRSAKLVLTDRLIKETAPLDASGADRIVKER